MQEPWRECRLPELDPDQTQGKEMAEALDRSEVRS